MNVIERSPTGHCLRASPGQQTAALLTLPLNQEAGTLIVQYPSAWLNGFYYSAGDALALAAACPHTVRAAV
ncbi:hypothetical protein [Rhizobium leguminosarum]